MWTVPQSQGLLDGTFSLFRCTECHLGYISPRPSEAMLVRLYDQDFYEAPRTPNRLTKNVHDMFLQRCRQRIERFVRPGRLLDVGCGDGHFLRTMAAHGWDSVGYDFSPTARALAASANPRISILDGQLADHDLPDGSFDLITLWQVLEHIPEPLTLLRRLRRLLRPGGLLVVAVPNIDSLQAKIAGDRWWGLDIPRHLTHFGPKSLKRTLTTADFSFRGMNHLSFRYAPYALFHSLLDHLFTRRHFLSDFAKRTLPANLGRMEYGYNVAALTLASPLLAPVCVLETLISSQFARGGFIEAYATVKA
jgi:2-polyprenyl-3-methyl-5-hydroxy-6-metoxy-1,4-benzoquinol methylase